MPGLQPRGRLAEQPAQGTTVAGWGASIPWYGEPQSHGMGSLNPKVWNELHHHVTRSFDEWKLTDKDIPAFVSLSLRVQQRALRRHLGGAVDDASGGDRG